MKDFWRPRSHGNFPGSLLSTFALLFVTKLKMPLFGIQTIHWQNRIARILLDIP